MMYEVKCVYPAPKNPKAAHRLAFMPCMVFKFNTPQRVDEFIADIDDEVEVTIAYCGRKLTIEEWRNRHRRRPSLGN